ncbi:pro-epidermal growth factor isoform X1 [Hippocampus comes]|uniref:pro-epidermal growth factor isoform X1 n=1 Tax=Hippocampus comes TaxID=109280 RepID=UPI00094E4F99|nr:PREDICTED: pro-epidermal growth factor isoform X1 [Hippocampus comes]
MLAATLTAALIYLTVQNSGTLALGTACWDEKLTRAGRNGSCVALQPFLIFGHGKAIHRMDLDGKNQRRLIAGVASSILLDFHFSEEQIYWVDKRTGIIYKSSVRGLHRQKLYSSDKHISGLTVDWIRNAVYWTSREKGRIKRMDTNGKSERTLVRHLTQPNSIVIDPTKRFLFWLSGGISPSIHRCDVTGQAKMTLIETSQQLKALSVDHRDRRLFWVQFGLQGESSIASTDYNGKALHIIDQPLQSDLLGIALFHKHIYYTDAASRAIKRINKYTGGEDLEVTLKQMAKVPVDIKVVHPDKQPMADSPSPLPGCDEQSGTCVNVCSGTAEQGVCQCSEGFALSKQGFYCEDVNECAHWNHGCSLGCENIPGSYFCTCPNGYALLPDKKTCREIMTCEGNATECGHGCLATDEGPVCVCPKGSVLKEDGQDCTGCSSADKGGCSQLCVPISPTRWRCDCLPGYQLHQDGKRCIASGPPPYLLVASLVAVQRINSDGTEGQILVHEPRGAIESLDYDPVSNHVYFASTSQKTIERVHMNGGSKRRVITNGPDSNHGLAVDWIHRKIYWTVTRQSILVSSTLDGLNVTTVVSSGLDKPTSITVHPLEKKLFWADIGHQPTVESCSLYGMDRRVIASTNLVSPGGLTVDFAEGRLFWCDESRVETCALDGSKRRILLENQVGRPFDLAVFEDSLWIVDRERRQLMSVYKQTGRELQRLLVDLVQPASVVVVHPLAKPGLGLDNKSTDKTLNDESTPHTPSNRAAVDSEVEARTFTDKMVSDKHECYSAGSCGPNAKCLLNAGSPTCSCLEGFTGDGHLCVDIRKTPPSMTSSHPGNSVESCPSTHESYCLYQGICFYFPEVESYACNCVAGYMGERCQFSDLEWWELQQAEEERRRNVVVASCMVLLICLLSIAACVTYCYRTRGLFRKQPSADNVSKTSATDEDVLETNKDGVCQVYTVMNNDPKGSTLPAPGCPRRAVCPSCSSETGTASDCERERRAGSQNTFALPSVRRQPARRTRDVVYTESGVRVFHGVHCCHGNQPAIPPQLESVARLHPTGVTPKCKVS